MPNTVKLGELLGIPIQVHYTWFLAFILVTWSLATGFFPSMFRGWDPAMYWIVGALAAIGLFASVLIHELSHSLVAMARGLGVHSITLFIFGGVSAIAEEAEEPKDEFLVSVVGPLASVVLAGVFWAVLQVVPSDGGPLMAILSYLAFINVLLAVFNLLPGFPLDGGRVLRSIIWAVSGNLRRATDWASYVGQAMGFLLIFWGLYQLLNGNFLGGLWIAFIGWFLNSGAEGSRQQLRVRESLAGVRIAELMNPSPPLAQLSLNTHDFVFEHVLRQGIRAMPVIQDGRLVGIVSITDAKAIPPAEWPSTPVAAIMTPAPLKTLPADADMQAALTLLGDGEVNQAPVVRDGELVGMLSRADLLRFIKLSQELKLPRRTMRVMRTPGRV